MVFLKNTETEVKSKCSEMTPAIAYVDGSYDILTNSFSYGMVLFIDGQEVHFSENFLNQIVRDE